MAIRLCPKCNGKVSSSRNDCPHCGYIFSENKQCPDCKEFIPLDSKECPVCGFYFNSNDVEDFLYNGIETECIQDKNFISSQEEDDNKAVVESADIYDNAKELNAKDCLEQSECLECPYCGEKSLMQIGINYFMCETCRGKFLNSYHDKCTDWPKDMVELKSNENLSKDESACEQIHVISDQLKEEEHNKITILENNQEVIQKSSLKRIVFILILIVL